MIFNLRNLQNCEIVDFSLKFEIFPNFQNCFLLYFFLTIYISKQIMFVPISFIEFLFLIYCEYLLCSISREKMYTAIDSIKFRKQPPVFCVYSKYISYIYLISSAEVLCQNPQNYYSLCI